MYTVYCDGSLLYDPRVDELKLTNKKLELEVNQAGGFDFTIHPDHPLYGQIHKLKSVIEVYQDSVLLFRGRPLNDELSFHNSRRILCEGDLAFLNDSIQRPYDFAGTITEYLTQIISNHNNQVDADRQFTLGNVTVTDLNDYITRSDSSYPTTWEVVKTKLLDLLGGYIVIRRESDINYIDYLVDSPYMTTQKIELGENLLDAVRERQGQDIATAIIPLGATITDEEGIESRLDITSVNGGVDFIYDADAVAEYGYIFKVVEFNDVTVASNLLTKAQQVLADAIQTSVNITLRAIDKSMIDVAIDELRIFEYVQVTSAPHELDELYLIKKLSIDMDNPANNTVEIGKTFKTFTDQKLQSDKVIKEIKSDYVKNEKITEVKSTIESISSSIEQTADSIRTEVATNYVSQNNFETYQSEVSTQFSQTSDSFNFQFSNLETWVSSLDGDTKATFEEWLKYIRFVDGNIELGETGNPIMLTIENDRISFKQSGVEVAYFSNNQFYVTDGNFTNSLKVGNFAFEPRSNGNLSFTKVV